LADDQPRAGDVQNHLHFVARPLDLNPVNPRALVGLGRMVLDEIPNPEIFHQQRPKLLLARIPAALPVPHDSHAEADRIDFLTHNVLACWYSPACSGLSKPVYSSLMSSSCTEMWLVRRKIMK